MVGQLCDAHEAASQWCELTSRNDLFYALPSTVLTTACRSAVAWLKLEHKRPKYPTISTHVLNPHALYGRSILSLPTIFGLSGIQKKTYLRSNRNWNGGTSKTVYIYKKNEPTLFMPSVHVNHHEILYTAVCDPLANVSSVRMRRRRQRL